MAERRVYKSNQIAIQTNSEQTGSYTLSVRTRDKTAIESYKIPRGKLKEMGAAKTNGQLFKILSKIDSELPQNLEKFVSLDDIKIAAACAVETEIQRRRHQ